MTTHEKRIVSGWAGRFWEDFEVGQVFKHPLGRTVTWEDDIYLVTSQLNTMQAHFDEYYAKQTEFGTVLVMAGIALGIATGLASADITTNLVKEIRWGETRFPNPVAVGDTIYAESVLLEKRESDRPDAGIITFKTRGYKHDGKIVNEAIRTALIYKRGHSPRNKLVTQQGIEKA